MAYVSFEDSFLIKEQTAQKLCELYEGKITTAGAWLFATEAMRREAIGLPIKKAGPGDSPVFAHARQLALQHITGFRPK